MSAYPAPLVCAPDGHCITCSDEGLPMRVMALADDGLATCRGATGAPGEVDVLLVEPVRVGDEVLVHAGVALVLIAPGPGGRP